MKQFNIPQVYTYIYFWFKIRYLLLNKPPVMSGGNKNNYTMKNELCIDLNKYTTITEKMELLEDIMDLLEMDYGIDDHTTDKGYPYYFIQIEQEEMNKLETFIETI